MAAAADDWALADRLVEAMGGRANWLPLKGLSIRARHFEAAVPQPYDNACSLPLPSHECASRDATRL